MSWTLAPALKTLIAEVNAIWPNRDRSSDGTIGDTAHQRGVSEHNPDSRGVVRAADITEGGVDIQRILSACIGDPRVHYVIYHGRICSRTYGWEWRPSSGHEHHMHVSLLNRTSGRFSWEDVERAAGDTGTWLHRNNGGPSGRGATESEVGVVTPEDIDRIASAVWAAGFGGGQKASDLLGRAANPPADEAAYIADLAAQHVWAATFGDSPDNAGARLARAVSQTGDIMREGPVSLRQEVADAKSGVLRLESRMDRIDAALEKLLAAQDHAS